MNKEQILKEITDACVVAYERAKKGGYKGRLYAPKLGAELLDPLFWQALGKSENWDNETISFKVSKQKVDVMGKFYIRKAHTVIRPRWKKKGSAWKFYFHQFIDHLIEGKPIDEFFNKLIK